MIEPLTRFAIGDALFTEAIINAGAELPQTLVVGLCGSQGSGKSTTALRLRERIIATGRQMVVCSLDDFYLTSGDRAALAADIHPLLATRGVPGTHDVALMRATLDALSNAGPSSRIPIPVFDKAADDRVEKSGWTVWEGRPDIILIEGWCVNARPQPAQALRDPVNLLERDEDSDGVWRTYVNEQLAGPYCDLFETIDLSLMLAAPDFACVHGWRAEQEAKLSRSAPRSRSPMSDAELARFIAHYERITRWLLETRPADLVALLDRSRVPYAWRSSTTQDLA